MFIKIIIIKHQPSNNNCGKGLKIIPDIEKFKENFVKRKNSLKADGGFLPPIRKNNNLPTLTIK